MIRNLKALGLALIAVFAIGAVAASAASALPTFHSEETLTVLTGEGTLTFASQHAGGLTVTCKGTFGGTTSEKTVSKVIVHPTFEKPKEPNECTSSLGTHPEVDTTGCDFVLFSSTTLHPKTEAGEETDSPVEQECTTGNSTIITDTCPITFPAQANLHGVKYDNEGSGTTRDIKVTSTVDKLKYTVPDTFACTFVGLKSAETGTLTGSVTVKGFKDLDTLPPTTHQDVFKEGTQVGIWWE